MKEEQVYIVDYELLSPIAFGKSNLFQGLKDNVLGGRTLTSFDASGMPFKVGAEIPKDLKYLYREEDERIVNTCKYDRKFELIVACYKVAEERFNSIVKNIKPEEGGVFLGVGADVTRFGLFEKELLALFESGDADLKDLIVSQNTMKGMLNTIWNPYDIHAIYVAEKMGLGAMQKTILTACTSSTQAIAFGFDAIKSRNIEVAVCGGTDSIINTIAMASFGKLGVIPESEQLEKIACTPFDKNRKGTLAGEAAGLVVLVSASFAERNNLIPIAEFLGYGNTLDGYKITAPDPSGAEMKNAMKLALKKAKIKPNQIDYIQAHGTATRHNDAIELAAIKSVFKDSLSGIDISSTKNRHGHAIAAAGIQEFNVLLNCFENDFVPGNINLKNPLDEEVTLVKENKYKRSEYAITNNFAFGGVNTSLVLKNLKK